MKIKVKKDILKIALFFIGILFVCVLFFRLLSIWESRYSIVNTDSIYAYDTSIPNENRDGVFYEEQWYVPRENMETILIIGIDKYEHEVGQESYHNTQQADFLMLLILDNENGSYSTVQLNRDTITSISQLGVQGEAAGSFMGQLALSHTYGRDDKERCENTVKGVSNLLYGVEIDHYISFTMDAVAEMNDAVGGVSLALLDDFTAYHFTMVKGREVKLTGEMALTYVRSRKDIEDTSNLKRMKRQEQYLRALQGRIKGCVKENAKFPRETLGVLSKYMASDCTANELMDLYEKGAVYRDEGIISIDGETVKGKEYIEFYADQELLKKMVIDVFYQRYA